MGIWLMILLKLILSILIHGMKVILGTHTTSNNQCKLQAIYLKKINMIRVVRQY